MEELRKMINELIKNVSELVQLVNAYENTKVERGKKLTDLKEVRGREREK